MRSDASLPIDSMHLSMRRAAPVLLLITASAVGGSALGAQRSRRLVSRADAIESALTRALAVHAAGADTLVAVGQLLAARALANPALTASYTKSAPQYHAELDLPLPLPWLRRPRVGAAASAATAARLRYDLARASAALDADTSYTLAVAAIARAALSAHTAADADTLLRMAIARRDAGDASELDVELARVNAGQQVNAAAGDSLVVQSALLDLQLAMGLDTDSVVAFPTDSLEAPPQPGTSGGEPLAVSAAVAGLRSASSGLTAERRAAWGAPSLIAGIETHDPSGAEPGVLPVIGVALPLPLFDRNRGGVTIALAERERARAELALARLESRTRVVEAERTLAAARARVARGRTLVASANRIAAMSLTAYREGASTLPNVLEAQRNAREILGQYVDDLARAWIAGATLRTLTLTAAASR